MDTLESKFVILDKDHKLNLYLMPHILKCEKSRYIPIANIDEFKTLDPITITFSADEHYMFIAYNNNLTMARIGSLIDLFDE